MEDIISCEYFPMDKSDMWAEFLHALLHMILDDPLSHWFRFSYKKKHDCMQPDNKDLHSFEARSAKVCDQK